MTMEQNELANQENEDKNEIPIDIDEPSLEPLIDMLLEETEFLLDDKV